MKIPFVGADEIREILRRLECDAEVVVSAQCPFCKANYSLLLVGRTGRYECLTCLECGELGELYHYADGLFEKRHRETIKLMTERKAVDPKGGGGG